MPDELDDFVDAAEREMEAKEIWRFLAQALQSLSPLITVGHNRQHERFEVLVEFAIYTSHGRVITHSVGTLISEQDMAEQTATSQQWARYIGANGKAAANSILEKLEKANVNHGMRAATYQSPFGTPNHLDAASSAMVGETVDYPATRRHAEKLVKDQLDKEMQELLRGSGDSTKP